MRVWAKVAVAEICSPAKRYTTPTPREIYRQLEVSLWGIVIRNANVVLIPETLEPVFSNGY